MLNQLCPHKKIALHIDFPRQMHGSSNREDLLYMSSNQDIFEIAFGNSKIVQCSNEQI